MTTLDSISGQSEDTQERKRFPHEVVSALQHAPRMWRTVRKQSVVQKFLVSAWNDIPNIRALESEERVAYEVHLPTQYNIRIMRCRWWLRHIGRASESDV